MKYALVTGMIRVNRALSEMVRTVGGIVNCSSAKNSAVIARSAHVCADLAVAIQK